MIYSLFKSTNVFLLGPLSHMPQIREIFAASGNPPCWFCPVFCCFPKRRTWIPGISFLDFFPWCSELRLGCRLSSLSRGQTGIGDVKLWAQREREGGNALLVPAARQVISASCWLLAPLHSK